MRATMSNTDFMPLFVTKVKNSGNSEPTPAANSLPQSVVGSFVPKTVDLVGGNVKVATNIDQDNEMLGFSQLNELDAPFFFYNNDPIVDLNNDDEDELVVDEVVEFPSLRLDCAPKNHGAEQQQIPRNENQHTPRTSSS
uniref:Uncharacterized protein n=1 Tax=Cannabis sativa TaxID=3483 RepID=A0A803QSM3_CANSA